VDVVDVGGQEGRGEEVEARGREAQTKEPSLYSIAAVSSRLLQGSERPLSTVESLFCKVLTVTEWHGREDALKIASKSYVHHCRGLYGTDSVTGKKNLLRSPVSFGPKFRLIRTPWSNEDPHYLFGDDSHRGRSL